MSALRKLKRRFVLETRSDDNFIKTAVSRREGPPRGPGRCGISRAIDSGYPSMMLISTDKEFPGRLAARLYRSETAFYDIFTPGDKRLLGSPNEPVLCSPVSSSPST